jgi:site-specific DNA-methyltransferase (adenine-specific)
MNNHVTIGPCQLYLGDCVRMKHALPGFDAIITDPPYGIDFHYGERKTGLIARPASKPIHGDDRPFDPGPWLEGERKMAFFGANHYAKRIPEAQGDWIAWDKACGQGPNASFRDVEFIWMSTKSARNIFHFQWQGACRAGEDSPSKAKRLHVSQKPVELLVWLIHTMRVKLGGVILDPYMGSGSTGVAALRTGRKFVGVEIDRENFDIAVERLSKEVEKLGL